MAIGEERRRARIDLGRRVKAATEAVEDDRRSLGSSVVRAAAEQDQPENWMFVLAEQAWKRRRRYS
jgi:hypothetical protein